MSNALDILLGAELPTPPTSEIKLLRLSKACGADVVFKIKALSYSRTAEIQKLHDEEANVHILLAGVTEPDLKNKDLLSKYSVPTPADLVKKMLLPGEVEDISRAIETLSGYRAATIEEVKKK